jgi:hypothetical protein
MHDWRTWSTGQFISWRRLSLQWSLLGFSFWCLGMCFGLIGILVIHGQRNGEHRLVSPRRSASFSTRWLLVSTTLSNVRFHFGVPLSCASVARDWICDRWLIPAVEPVNLRSQVSAESSNPNFQWVKDFAFRFYSFSVDCSFSFSQTFVFQN